MIEDKRKISALDKNYISLGYLWILLVLVFYLVGEISERYYAVLEIRSFLYYHTFLEFFSIVISFTIFTVSYYTYKRNGNTRLLIYFCIFFIVGFIDFFHTMTYSGMPGFFGESSIPVATTFWMLGRLIFAVGMLFAAITPIEEKTFHERSYYLGIVILFVAIIFYLVNNHIDYFPAMFIEGQGLTPIKVALEYLVMALLGFAILFFLKNYKKTKNTVFIKLAAGLSFGIFSEVCFTLYFNVHDSQNMLGHIYKVVSYYLIFRSIFVENLDIPYVKLNHAREKISEYADNLERLVEERTKELKKANDKITRDLEYAKKIQQSLLPSKELTLNDVSFVSELIPCQNVSGDFYDIYEIDDKNTGIFLADVSGHGPSAAMMTVYTERVITSKHNYYDIEEMLDCEKVLSHFYQEFNKSNFPDEMHIAILNGIYNKTTGIFSYCSAGMNTIPILLRATGSIENLDESKGFPICKFGTFYTPIYQKAEIKLEKGDRIVFYTDGLVEGFKHNTLLTKKGLEEVLLENKTTTPQRLRDQINKEIGKLVGQESIHDDITFLIMDI